MYIFALFFIFIRTFSHCLIIKNHVDIEIGNSASFELLSPTSEIRTLCSEGPKTTKYLIISYSYIVEWNRSVENRFNSWNRSSMRSTLVLFAALALFGGSAFGAKFRTLIFLFIIIWYSWIIYSIAKDIPKCKIGDTDCMVKSANKIIENYGSVGFRSINLLPLDPLAVPRIYIKQGAESPVNVELVFTNNTVNGIKNCEFFKMK